MKSARTFESKAAREASSTAIAIELTCEKSKLLSQQMKKRLPQLLPSIKAEIKQTANVSSPTGTLGQTIVEVDKKSGSNKNLHTSSDSDMPTELKASQSAQPVTKLAETNLAKTTAVSKRSLSRGLPNPWRVPSELLKPSTPKVEKIEQAVENHLKCPKSFELPYMAPCPPKKPPSPTFYRFNPGEANWSPNQPVPPNITIIHNYYGEKNERPERKKIFTSYPLEMSRNQFKKFCRTIPKSEGDRLAKIRRKK